MAAVHPPLTLHLLLPQIPLLQKPPLLLIPKKEDLIFVNYRDIRDLNPHLYAGEMYAQEMLYEGLVNITADGFEGCLAESWDVSEDGKVYLPHPPGRAVLRWREM